MSSHSDWFAHSCSSFSALSLRILWKLAWSKPNRLRFSLSFIFRHFPWLFPSFLGFPACTFLLFSTVSSFFQKLPYPSFPNLSTIFPHFPSFSFGFPAFFLISFLPFQGTEGELNPTVTKLRNGTRPFQKFKSDTTHSPYAHFVRDKNLAYRLAFVKK